MEQIEDNPQINDWWQYPLTLFEDSDVDHCWAYLLQHGKVEIGLNASITGNIIALTSELAAKSPQWKQHLEIQHTRKDKKYDQIYKKVHRLTKYN